MALLEEVAGRRTSGLVDEEAVMGINNCSSTIEAIDAFTRIAVGFSDGFDFLDRS